MNKPISTLAEDFAQLGISHMGVTPPPVTEQKKPGTPGVAKPTEALQEGSRIARQVRIGPGGKVRRVKTKRTSMAKKIANRSYHRKHKSQLKRRNAKASVQRRAARRDKIRARVKHEGLDSRVDDLMESVAGLVDRAKGSNRVNSLPDLSEAAYTFANLALISEMISGAFTSFAEQEEDFELSTFEVVALREMAATYDGIAEDCAEQAEELKKGDLEENDRADVEKSFKSYVEAVLDGVDAFGCLTEEDEDEDDDEDDDDEDDEEEECEDCGEEPCECEKGK